MMKTARPFVIGAAAVAVALLAVLALAANGNVQTWAARRWLGAHPELGAQVGRVQLSWNHVEVRALHWHGRSGTLEAPVVTAEVGFLPLLLHRRLEIGRVEANGWTFGLADSPAAAGEQIASAGPTATQRSATPPTRPQSSPVGLFQRFELPLPIQVGAVAISGAIRSRDRVYAVSAKGGGLGAGADGTLDFKLDTPPTADDARAVALVGTLRLHFASARIVDRIAVDAAATASGGMLAKPVTLRVALSATDERAQEHYQVELHDGDRALAMITGRFSPTSRQIEGNWKVNLSDRDLAPFALGHELPEMELSGAGAMTTDLGSSGVHASGTLNAVLDRLAAVDPRLDGVGPLRFTASVDFAQAAGLVTVRELDLTVSRAGAADGKVVAFVRALQAFGFRPESGEVTPTRPTDPLLDITLGAVPLAWTKPFMPGWDISGHDLTGEVVATPRAGGVTFRTHRPLSIAQADVSHNGTPLLRGLDLALGVSGDYTPEGWQAEFNGVTARSGAATVFLLDAKAGRLAGKGQPIKATGMLSVDLVALLAQPIARQVASVQHGTANLDFSASFGEATALRATIALKDLVGAGGASLPAVSATVRADVAGDGKLTLELPIKLVRDGRTSDASLVGTMQPRANGGSFDARLTSSNLVIDDAQAFRVMFAPNASAPTQPPAWAGWQGTVAVQLNRVTAPGGFELMNLTGRLHLADGTVQFEKASATGGNAPAPNATAGAGAPPARGHLQADAEIVIGSFDPGPLFTAYNPHFPPTVEGPFELKGTLRADADRWSELAHTTYGEVALTSKGGVFRGLNVNVGNLVENSSKLVGWLTAAGQAIAAPFSGRKDVDEITSRSQAAQELAKILSNIAYDQLAVTISAEPGGRARVKEFSLISPDLRIAGQGAAQRVQELPFVRQEVMLELSLRARGRPAELMKYLGVLDGNPDDLGYAGCTIPVRVDGALDRLDTTQLSNRLVALAVAKTGLTEKAVDWINRLRGKTAN